MSAPPVTSTDITELQDSGLSWCSSRPGTKSKQNVRQSRINGRYCCRRGRALWSFGVYDVSEIWLGVSLVVRVRSLCAL